MTLLQEAEANTDPSSSDTDGDGLNDSYEWLTIGTDPTLSDTDSDYLDDKWELTYNGTISGVNPLVAATGDLLISDADSDGLTLIEEAAANTNSLRNDTDGDGLTDEWEVRYNGAFGVNPLVNATADELASDNDSDGLTLLEEFKAKTNPEVADNPMPEITTMSPTSTVPSASDTTSENEDNPFLSLPIIPILFGIFVLLVGITIIFVIIRRRRKKSRTRRSR